MKGALAVERSTNAKLGNVSATYVSQGSCPNDCPHKNNGCYAETAWVGITTRRVNKGVGSPAELAEAEAEAIDGLSGNHLLRLHVVGDCRTNRAAQIVGKAVGRYANRGVMRPKRGKVAWTYTHGWRKVKRESWGKAVSVLASCERPQDAISAMKAGYAAALVVTAFEGQAAYTVEGVKVLPCPAQTRGVTCEQCGLCRDDERLRKAGIVIGFEPHGWQAETVRRTLLSLQTV